MLQRKLVQRLVHSQQLVIDRRSGQVETFEIHALVASAVAARVFPPRPVNQNAPHRFSAGTKEMLPIFERRSPIANQTQPSLVHQRSRLKGLAGSFVSQL